MIDRLVLVATVVSVVGSGLAAGLLFAFSAFMMRALGRLPAPQGIAAMQSVNTTILTPLFRLVFVGTAVLGLLLVVDAIVRDQQGAGWRVAGALLYVLGVLAVTVVFNIPLNNALDEVDPASADGAALWQRYLAAWTAWNHVRTVAGVAATTLLALAVRFS